jgi:hypothetical protein
LKRAEGLRSKEDEHKIGKEELELYASGERRSSGAGKPLDRSNARKRKERRQNGGEYDFPLPVQGKEKGPDEKQQPRGGFKNGQGPIFDTAMGQDAKNQKSADRDAQGSH